jgi:hypothetical protein
MSPQHFSPARMATVIGMTGKMPLITTVFRIWMERLLNHRSIFDVISLRRGERSSKTNMKMKIAAKDTTLTGIS